MMVLRTFLPLPIRCRCCNKLLNGIAKSIQRKQLISSLFPLHRNYSCLVVSSVFDYAVPQVNIKFSYSVAIKEINKLNDLICQNFKNVDIKGNEERKKILIYLLSKGYTSKIIREKFLIYLKSKDISCTKFSLLEDIDSDIALLLPLLTLSRSILKLAADTARIDRSRNKSSRIYYLSHHLELEPSDLVPALTKHSSLLTMKFERLDNKMNILKNANISAEYIVKDLWIFNYNEQMIANRIQTALKSGVELKPWMLRCSKTTFESILVKNSESHRILGGESVCSYLAKRLDCSTDYVDYLMLKNKLLKAINVSKLEQIINFLFEKGYTPQEVRLFPRVFCSSVQTLEKRFEELQHMKSTLPTMAQLCMSTKKACSHLKKKS